MRRPGRTLGIFLVALVSQLSHSQDKVPNEHLNEQHLSCGNKYSKDCNPKLPLSDEEMFQRGHMKPFGSHRPPDEMVEEIEFMISPQDFFMKYVIKHKPVVLKGKSWSN